MPTAPDALRLHLNAWHGRRLAHPRRGPGPRSVRGVTLVELVVSLALAAVLVGALFNAFSLLSGRSADPLVQRQALAVAESLLHEMELQPLPGAGATAVATPGRTGFASLADYQGLVLSGIRDAEGQPITGLENYRAEFSVLQQAADGSASTAGWWARVRVLAPGGQAVDLALWRAAP